ncbi:hypothetical protein JR316_0010988 [Psilocybe cubensis]|uniref:Ankyrin n=2 Tax=Psilocybe cubensis TaxID=181762 RepID=A0A8H8CFY1_PSICU|nr:hypothetical protein JR316_0010988 [Psilocybe cubensis]KAH9477072.1 hypothetical protein JR316_0010988 [Psilocybe cubensis]
METLPQYAECQLPQSPFDALITRICGRLAHTVPEARVILESFVEGQRAPGYNVSENDNETPKPIERFPQDPTIGEATNSNNFFQLVAVKKAIVLEFFDAIAREDNETVSLLIQHNIVTANTTSKTGKTPLLEAISANNLTVVKQLLDLGADPNSFGTIHEPNQRNATRTPLMLAASNGSLPLVKLLFEPPYSADDSLIAPDGQIALRLAAKNGHRTIVDYLPSRRGGHYLRFKEKNSKNIARIKKALNGIYQFVKFFVWELPKFFLWSVPKHVVVLPIAKTYKYCWSNRKAFGTWCKRQAAEVPKRIWKSMKKVPRAIGVAGKGAWRFVTVTVPLWLKTSSKWLWALFTQRIPKAVFSSLKWIWQIIKKIPKATVDATITLAKWLKSLATWVWNLITKRIPRAIVIALKWMWTGVKASGQAVWDVILKFLSFLHAIFSAVVSFLRDVTFTDILNAFHVFLSAVFISLPRTVWSWVERLGTVSYKVMETLFGSLGKLVWWIGAGIFWLIVYVPKQCWAILRSLGNSFAEGIHEIRIWINPKA